MYKYFLLPLLLAAACSEPKDETDDTDATDTSSTDTSDTEDSDDPSIVLAGQSYWLDSSEGFTPVTGTTVSLRFHEDSEAGVRFSLNADCNTIGGYLLIDDATGTKLAKRRNSPSLADRRRAGEDGAALAAALRGHRFPAGISLGQRLHRGT